MQPILSCHIGSRLVFYSCVCISMYNWSNGDFSNSETIVACFYFCYYYLFHYSLQYSNRVKFVIVRCPFPAFPSLSNQGLSLLFLSH